MPSKYCYYVHHHGSGHIMRAIAIAKAFPVDSTITFMGSDLKRYAKQIPDHIACVHLPMDTGTTHENQSETQTVSFLHYAPLLVPGLLHRNLFMIDFFRENPTTLFIVDVSVEVTLLARLCGIPTVIIRQSGKRTDTAHRIAYESAELIIAPFSANLDAAHDNPAVDKTCYAGGFSRYTGMKIDPLRSQKNDVAVFIGQGGSNIDLSLIQHIRNKINSDIKIHIIGELFDQVQLENTYYHGHVAWPEEILSACDVVICNAGHNTVMELADLQKKMICIPAKRPFDEQIKKALYLEEVGCAIVVLEENIYTNDWELSLVRARRIDIEKLTKITNARAIKTIKKALEVVHDRFFATPLKQVLHV